jgi:GABA(A) receptor-associated protein
MSNAIEKTKFMDKTFEEKKKEGDIVRKKYPDHVPVIVTKAKKSNICEIDKNKFLVPGYLTIGQVIYVIRKRIKLKKEQAIFLFINNTLPPTSALMSQIYKEKMSTCGFLYVTYATESTFG